jgi:hypothetical protein
MVNSEFHLCICPSLHENHRFAARIHSKKALIDVSTQRSFNPVPALVSLICPLHRVQTANLF